MRMNSSQSAASGPRRSSGRSLRSRAALRHLEQADGAVGALHGEAALGERHVRRIGLQHVTGDFRRLLDHRLRRLAHDDAAHAHRARRMRAAADRHDVGVALDQLDAVRHRRRAIRRRIARSSSRGPGRSTACRSRPRLALRLHVDLRPFARRAAGDLDDSWQARCRAASCCVLDSRLRLPKPFQSDSASARSMILRSRRSRRSCRAALAIGLRRRRDEVAAAQVDAVEAELLRRDVDEPLDHEHRLRAARRCDRDWSAACWSSAARARICAAGTR